MLSVIVPVYNVSKFIKPCLNSILFQTYSDFEVLLVDDGSTDDSGEICDEYAERDIRIKVFHKKNGGVSSARNFGLNHAKGEFVCFVDADDIIPRDCLKNLTTNLLENVDMVFGGIQKFSEESDCIERISTESKTFLDKSGCLDLFLPPVNSESDWHRYLYNRIYRRTIIEKNNIRFNTRIHYKEDGLFVVQYICSCRQGFIYIPEIVYYYRQNNQGAMLSLKKTFNKRLLTNVDAHGKILSTLRRNHIRPDLLAREERHLLQNYEWILSIMKHTGAAKKRNRIHLNIKLINNIGLKEYVWGFIFPRLKKKIKAIVYK